ncbi:MAG: hypothetical protein FWE67_07750 [Planctomycetaceae bacterium]|nr:hypothetical protein [Planctomycetaceae bacterium]
MKNISFCLVILTILIFTGCRLAGNSQPSNPFASIQTAPPPATFSAQGAYLGQTPSAYMPSTIPTTVPATGIGEQFSPVNTPTNPAQPYFVPADAGYGSLNPSQGTLLFQDSNQNVNQTPTATQTTTPTTGWSAAPAATEPATAAQSIPITAGYANQTAAQGMEGIAGQSIQAGGNITGVSYIDPNAVVASSAQITTVIEDSKNTAPATAEPKTMYANQH